MTTQTIEKPNCVPLSELQYNVHDAAYASLLQLVLDEGVDKGNRTGIDTRSVFGAQAKFDLSKGFPLLTTKKMAWKSIVGELLWFISGDTNVRTLAAQGINIWNDNGYDHYKKTRMTLMSNKGERVPLCEHPKFPEWHPLLTKEEWLAKIINDKEFAAVAGSLGDAYGKQWRRFSDGKFQVDQLRAVVERIQEKPDDRRLIVTAWNPVEVNTCALPPCHCFFQFYTRPHPENDGLRWLDLHLIKRSTDSFLGLPFNLASYALLLSLIAKQVGMVPGVLTISFGDLHIYHNHLDQVREQLTRDSFPAPTIRIRDGVKSLFDYTKDDIELIGYQSHPAIKAEMAV